MWNPAIPDWRTWRKYGEHGEHAEHGRYKPYELKHFICDLKHSIHVSKVSICPPGANRVKIDPGTRLKFAFAAFQGKS